MSAPVVKRIDHVGIAVEDVDAALATYAEQFELGPVHREQMSRMRRTIAANMVRSVSTIPHLTNFDDADVTELERLRKASAEDHAKANVKLTALSFVIKAVSLGYVGLTVNLANGDKANNPLGKDPKVRRALELAIDREALNQVVFNGEFVPGNQWVSPQNPYYQAAMPVPKRDVAKAKALLKEAGVTGPLALDMMVPNNAEFKQVAEVVQSMAAEAGFDLKIRLTEFATSLKQAEDGNFQVYLIGWSGRSDPDGNSVVFYTCNAPQNNSKYCNPEVDAALKLARAKSDFADRKKAYETATRNVMADGSIIYLYHPQVLVALTDKVEGYKQMPDGLIRVVGVKVK